MLNIKITLPQSSLSVSDHAERYCFRAMKDLKKRIILAYPRHFNDDNLFVAFTVVLAQGNHPVIADLYWDGAIADSSEFSRVNLFTKIAVILNDFYKERRIFVRFVLDDCPKSE